MEQKKSPPKNHNREISCQIHRGYCKTFFNTFFTGTGPRLAKKIKTPAKTLATYQQKWKTV